MSLGGDFEGCSQQTLNGTPVWVSGATGYGVLHLSFDPVGGAWKGALRDASGTATAQCDSQSTAGLCVASSVTCAPG